MLTFFRLFLFITLPLYTFSQEKLDPFQIYGPYGAKIYDNYSQALLTSENCYRLKLHNQDLNKNLKKLKKLNKLFVVELKNNNIDTIPEELSTFRNLMYFKSSGNPLKKLPESFGTTPTLKSLILHHVAMDSLPSSFNQLGSLMELEIQINNSDTFDVKNRLSGLFNLKTLMIYKSNLKS